jgi:integrase
VSIAKRILTDVAIRKAKPAAPGKREIMWDAAVPGLALRVSDRGRRSFVLCKRFPGKVQPEYRAIGEYGVISLEEARDTVREWAKLIKLGKDPREEERAKREAKEQEKRDAEEAKARADANTFAVAFELFATTHLATLRTGRDVEQIMRRVLLPAWGSKAIYAVHDGGSPIAANRLLAYVKKFDAWAVNRSLIDAPFAALMKAPAVETKRARVLTDLEIRALWGVCDQMGAFGRAVRLLLPTATRLGETSSMTWNEVDRAAGVWTLPRTRTKADREHKMPLSRLAMAILDNTPEQGPFVFTTSGKGPLRGWRRGTIGMGAMPRWRQRSMPGAPSSSASLPRRSW